MKPKHFFYNALIAIVLILHSCAPAYVPNVVNTPLLSNSGELQVALNTGVSGFDPQLSYAVTDHIGLMVNGSFADRTSDSTDDFHKHQFVEIGAGYYTKIGTTGRFETFGGYGFGKLQADVWLSHSDVTYNRIFIQPTIGAATSIFDGAFSTRVVMVNLQQDSNSNTGFFIEPVLTGKLGYKYVKGIFQLGFSFPVNGELEFNYQPFLFSIGIQADINRIFDE